MIFFLLSLFSTSAFQRKGFVRENEQPQDFWAKTWASLIENCNSVNVVFDQILAHFEKALQDFGIFYFAAFAVLVLFVIWPKKKKEIKGVKVNLEFLKEIKQLSHVGGLGGKRSDGVEVGVGVGKEVDKLNQKIKLFKESITAFQSEVFDSHLEIWKKLESSG